MASRKAHFRLFLGKGYMPEVIKKVSEVNEGFLKAILKKRADKIDVIPPGMDFPTLDELEMDVPLLNAHMDQLRVAPEDDSELDVQYLEHFNPSFSMTGISL